MGLCHQFLASPQIGDRLSDDTRLKRTTRRSKGKVPSSALGHPNGIISTHTRPRKTIQWPNCCSTSGLQIHQHLEQRRLPGCPLPLPSSPSPSSSMIHLRAKTVQAPSGSAATPTPSANPASRSSRMSSTRSRLDQPSEHEPDHRATGLAQLPRLLPPARLFIRPWPFPLPSRLRLRRSPHPQLIIWRRIKPPPSFRRRPTLWWPILSSSPRSTNSSSSHKPPRPTFFIRPATSILSNSSSINRRNDHRRFIRRPRQSTWDRRRRRAFPPPLPRLLRLRS